MLFTQIPESMLAKYGTEFVLGACPQLTSLTSIFNDNSVITSLALELPSLDHLSLRCCPLLETLRLTCPNLVHVSNSDCPRLSVPPPLMAQLTYFDGDVSLFFVIMGAL